MSNSVKWPFKLVVPAIVVAAATLSLSGVANAATHSGAPATRTAVHNVHHVNPMGCGRRPGTEFNCL